MERASFIEDRHLEFLDELRESGETNMFGARPYLMAEYPELSKQEGSAVTSYWMDTFGSETR